MASVTSLEIFGHVRIVMGMVIGLGLTRLLNGASRLVQHPRRERLGPIHLGWVFWTVLYLIHFWWWEFWLVNIQAWTFQLYLFLISYVILLFLLCTLLFPDDLRDYPDYEEVFFSRRPLFFGLIATIFIFDFVDTLLKGAEHYASFHGNYLIRLPIALLLCAIAGKTKNLWFHRGLVLAAIIHEVFWIFRLFDTLSPS